MTGIIPHISIQNHIQFLGRQIAAAVVHIDCRFRHFHACGNLIVGIEQLGGIGHLRQLAAAIVNGIFGGFRLNRENSNHHHQGQYET